MLSNSVKGKREKVIEKKNKGIRKRKREWGTGKWKKGKELAKREQGSESGEWERGNTEKRMGYKK